MHAIVVSGGVVPRRTRADTPSAFVVAADSGFDRAVEMGLNVDVVVGDLDSISAVGLARARAAGTTVIEYPSDKDQTDLVLAMSAAVERGATSITVLTGVGDRLDHFLAELLALTEVPARVTAIADDTLIHVVNPGGPVTLTGEIGDAVTLLAVHGAAVGVTTTGLAWTLDADTLQPGSTRGVSNVMTATTATVAITGGHLLAIQPGAHR
jgi:thiamine pyrophosphokinase